MKFDFQPTKTYATEANAEKAAQKLANNLEGRVRFMVVIDPKSNRYAPIFFNVSEEAMIGPIAWAGFTVVN